MTMELIAQGNASACQYTNDCQALPVTGLEIAILVIAGLILLAVGLVARHKSGEDDEEV